MRLMKRHLTVAAITALALLLAACSALRLGYREADTLLTWRADQYFNFSSAQKEDFRARLERLLAWHRYQQLPEYAVFLHAAYDKARAGIAYDDALWFVDGVKARYRTLVDHGAGDAATVLATLTPDNISALQKRFDKDNRKFADEHAVGGTPEARRKARVRKTLDQIEDWTGSLSRAQSEQAAALLDAVPYEDDLRYQDRLRRQREFIALLAQRKQPDFAARLHAWLADWTQGRSAEYQRVSDEYTRKSAQFYVAVDRMLTPDQRQRVLERVQAFIDDCRSLSANRVANLRELPHAEGKPSAARLDDELLALVE